MIWQVDLHKNVQNDLRDLGPAEAKTVLKVLEERIENGEPDKVGKPLHGILAGYKRFRTGSCRIVYRVENGKVHVLIIAVGQRRDDEIYEKASKRLN